MANENKDVTTVTENEGIDNRETAGATGTENSGNEGAEKTKQPETTGDKVFNQAQVTRMMAREKRQGREAALREIGIDPKDNEAVNAVKEYLESLKTPEQQVAERAVAENNELQQAKQRAMLAEARAEAMMSGIKPQYVEDAVTLALTKGHDEDGELKTVFAEFKDKYKMWFEETEEEKQEKANAGHRGTGTPVSVTGKNGAKVESLGERLAKQKQAQRANKGSFWKD